MRSNVPLALLWLGALCQCGLMVDLNRLDSSSAASSGPTIPGPTLDATSAAPPDAGADASSDDAPETPSATDDGEASASAHDDASDALPPSGGVGTGHDGDAASDAGGDAADTAHEDGGDAGKTGDASSDGSGDGASEACSPVQHDDGVGQTWQDCTPLGTYDQAEAMSACNAFGQNCIVEATCNVLDVYTFTGPVGNQTTHSWIYGTAGPVSVRAGDVLVFPRGNAPCNSLPPPVANWR